jgi:hypothetical protein
MFLKRVELKMKERKKKDRVPFLTFLFLSSAIVGISLSLLFWHHFF